MENFLIRASLPFIYLTQQIELMDTPSSLLPKQHDPYLQHWALSFFPYDLKLHKLILQDNFKVGFN